jgi:hypothetical protein
MVKTAMRKFWVEIKTVGLKRVAFIPLPQYLTAS